MFKWLLPNVNRGSSANQPASVAHPFVEADGDITDRRRGGRRNRAGRRESDLIAQHAEAPRVLIIAPKLDTRLLYTMLFEQAGWTVYAADEGSAGTALAQHHLPDAVVAEGGAPRTTAFGTLDQLRATSLTGNIPVVVITSSVHFDMPGDTRAAGPILVLAPPVDPDRLISSVMELAAITPPERSVRRQLTRTLLALREWAAHMKPDVDVQQRVRTLIDRLQVAVLALDERGRYVAASAAAAELTGYAQHELLAMSIFDSQLDADFMCHRDRWPKVLEAEQEGTTAIVRLGKRRTRTMKAAFLTIVPGLHAAALAPVLDTGN